LFAGKMLAYKNAAYVQRGDVTNVNALTVREVLRYAAYLRRTDRSSVSTATLLWQHILHWWDDEVPRLQSSTASAFGSGSGSSGNAEDSASKGSDRFYYGQIEERSDRALGPVVAPAGETTSHSEEDFACIEGKVDEVLTALGLVHIADKAVGHSPRSSREGGGGGRGRGSTYSGGFVGGSRSSSDGRGSSITAAELRCLSIGVELLNQPGLVFLEDPFSGLEWQDAEKVMYCSY
jgi:hypothetical protein